MKELKIKIDDLYDPAQVIKVLQTFDQICADLNNLYRLLGNLDSHLRIETSEMMELSGISMDDELNRFEEARANVLDAVMSHPYQITQVPVSETATLAKPPVSTKNTVNESNTDQEERTANADGSNT